MHSTSNLEDGYLGSGKRLRYSIRKHGEENHNKEILEYLSNREELCKREQQIVNDELRLDPLCMNLMNGGKGGFISAEQQLRRAKAASTKLVELRKIDLNLDLRLRLSASKTMSINHKNGLIKYNTFTGKKHSNETKKKISLSKQNKQKGELNSQYGTCWITNGKENKKIYKNDIIPTNWKLGRKMKNI